MDGIEDKDKGRVHTRIAFGENKLGTRVAGQRYAQTIKNFVCLGGTVAEHAELTAEIKLRRSFAWACFRKYKNRFNDHGVRHSNQSPN